MISLYGDQMAEVEPTRGNEKVKIDINQQRICASYVQTTLTVRNFSSNKDGEILLETKYRQSKRLHVYNEDGALDGLIGRSICFSAID